MIPTDGCWGDVRQDTYIKDRNGVVWRCVGYDPTEARGEHTGHFRLMNRDKTYVDIAPKLNTEHVTIMTMTEEDMIPLLRDKLGATVIATQDRATKAVTCPPWEEARAVGIELKWFRDHLALMHHIHPDDIKTYKQLVEAHAQCHDPEDIMSKRSIPHTHA